MDKKERKKALKFEQKNVMHIPKGWGFASDEKFMADGYTKVRFPVNDKGRKLNLASEAMWVKISEGNALNGTGVLDNIPLYSNFDVGQIIRYEEDEDGFPRYKAS